MILFLLNRHTNQITEPIVIFAKNSLSEFSEVDLWLRLGVNPFIKMMYRN